MKEWQSWGVFLWRKHFGKLDGKESRAKRGRGGGEEEERKGEKRRYIEKDEGAFSGHLIGVLREIRRLGSGFSEVDSVFLKKKSALCVHGLLTRLCIFMENGVDLGKPPTPNVGFGGYLGNRR